jgi:hypothetical protein
MTPVDGFNDKPGGRFPVVTVQVEYEPVPPVAESACEYAIPTVAEGSGEGVVMLGGPVEDDGSTTIENA